MIVRAKLSALKQGHWYVEAWVEDVKANREQLHTLGNLTIISVPAI